MRFERAYSQGNLIKTELVAAVLVKTVENRKKRGAPYVPQIAVINAGLDDLQKWYGKPMILMFNSLSRSAISHALNPILMLQRQYIRQLGWKHMVPMPLPTLVDRT
jgi:hypothetical protein